MHHLMRIVPIAVAAFATADCAFPFSVTDDAHVELALGAIDPACTSASGSVSVAGDDVSFDHHLSGDTCVLTSTATGPLLDLAPLEKKAGAAAQHIHITGVQIDIDDLVLRDQQNGDMELDASAVRSIEVHVDALGSNDVVVAHKNGSDAVAVATHITTSFINALDDQWQKDGTVTGGGTCELDLDQSKIDTLASAKLPSIKANLHIRVEGTDDDPFAR
ncbi:MAG TPA: hypothetical protein VGO62_17040 [Myxococcota bacterium]|jgi:hypothetical protein